MPRYRTESRSWVAVVARSASSRVGWQSYMFQNSAISVSRRPYSPVSKAQTPYLAQSRIPSGNSADPNWINTSRLYDWSWATSVSESVCLPILLTGVTTIVGTWKLLDSTVSAPSSLGHSHLSKCFQRVKRIDCGRDRLMLALPFD